MYKTGKIIGFKAISPVHVGSGSDLGVVDQPIQRERHTSYPKIEASSLKGAIRQKFVEKVEKNCLDAIFGPESGNEHSSCIAFTDARLLFFPVKSAKGTFALITCPKVLKRFYEDLDYLTKICDKKDNKLLEEIKYLKNLTTSNKEIIINNDNLKIKDKVILEEYVFKEKSNDKLKDLNNLFELNDKNLAIVSDDVFKYFVNYATEVITRTKIDPKTGIVVNGALFTEEYLPSETIMYTIALASNPFKKIEGVLSNENNVIDIVCNKLPKYMQIGGNTTLGKGIVKPLKL
ncbi:type III-B CRISPR module RAMP protein Cmr4 [Methanococcus voltae]|uniref:CRISPR-associated RAMP protein, Cmr4 family n=1 Tax=Methanococcus voltae (strain ATCC BAA-1334 / A3) TaxID=456320 RepID=D7DSV1_METV3|nr:type III-B CRISPR module RAMP protein Cmr4 [Methanococcus voltae]MCS3901811.1 CRISPR-associated protein Cmr4 [Methanococcus voltae]